MTTFSVNRFLVSEDGLTAAEYAIMAALIVVIAYIGGVHSLLIRALEDGGAGIVWGIGFVWRTYVVRG